MEHVLIIQNDQLESLGLYEQYIRDHAELTLIHAYNILKSEEPPDINEFTHFIIGPTPISANDVLKHDFLRKEWIYLQTIVDSGMPCFGVCCGGQILAKLLGGQVLKSPRKEIGGYRIKLTDQGTHDPLFSGFNRTFPVFQWHSDVFTVPSGAELLATGEPCFVQSYRKGNIWGVIFHLEITSKDAQRWVDAYPAELIQIGKTRDQVLDECLMNEDEMGQLASRLMKNFLSQ